MMLKAKIIFFFKRVMILFLHIHINECILSKLWQNLILFSLPYPWCCYCCCICPFLLIKFINEMLTKVNSKLKFFCEWILIYFCKLTLAIHQIYQMVTMVKQVSTCSFFFKESILERTKTKPNGYRFCSSNAEIQIVEASIILII